MMEAAASDQPTMVQRRGWRVLVHPAAAGDEFGHNRGIITSSRASVGAVTQLRRSMLGGLSARRISS
jgi:hypothetical protein